jgi:sulfur carrier protein ThiS
MAMEIRIKLMGILKEKTPAAGTIELQDGGTIDDALDCLDIAANRVQVFTVNGELVRDKAYRLAQHDELTVLPPVGGG